MDLQGRASTKGCICLRGLAVQDRGSIIRETACRTSEYGSRVDQDPKKVLVLVGTVKERAFPWDGSQPSFNPITWPYLAMPKGCTEKKV